MASPCVALCTCIIMIFCIDSAVLIAALGTFAVIGDVYLDNRKYPE